MKQKNIPSEYVADSAPIKGTSYAEVEKKARALHNQISARTKRSAYVRSVYFHKDKVFIGLFWAHLNQKRKRDRKRRLRYYACAIELIRLTRLEPLSKESPNKVGEILHRFAGTTPEGERFLVQIKEVKRTGSKYFMSVFPPN